MSGSETRVNSRAKAQPKQESRKRDPSTGRDSASADVASDMQEPQGPWGPMLGGDLSQSTFERHAGLLGDGILSQPANEGLRLQFAQHLQREYGNQYVQRLVKYVFGKRNVAAESEGSFDSEPATQPPDRQGSLLGKGQGPRQRSHGSTTRVLHSRHPFSATVSIAGLNRSTGEFSQPEALRPLARQHDAGPEEEPEPAVDLTSVSAPIPEEISEPAEGETVAIPDMVVSPMENLEQSDAIAGVLPYNGSYSQGGAAPSGFGVTRPYTHALSGITITNSSGTYFVNATLDNIFTYQVRADTGPSGQANVESADDDDITQANYSQVASDLTPDMSNLNGRPPRNQFWSRDLTIRHERFHADEDVVYGLAGTMAAQAWLNGQTASNAVQLAGLLAQVPGRVANTVSVGMAYPGREERAYGDGAPSYRARADAIKAKGDAGDYDGS